MWRRPSAEAICNPRSLFYLIADLWLSPPTMCRAAPGSLLDLEQYGDHLMSTSHRDPHNNDDQEERINGLKQKAEQAAKGQMVSWESDTLSAEVGERFWRHVAQYEAEPSTTDFQRLIEAGLELPEPDA